MFDLIPVLTQFPLLVAQELATAERKIARWERRLASGSFSARAEPMVRADLSIQRDFVRALRALPTQEG